MKITIPEILVAAMLAGSPFWMPWVSYLITGNYLNFGG